MAGHCVLKYVIPALRKLQWALAFKCDEPLKTSGSFARLKSLITLVGEKLTTRRSNEPYTLL